MIRVRSIAGPLAGVLLLAACAAGARPATPAPLGPAVPGSPAATAGSGVQPLRDDAGGPRLHVTVAGGCPASPGDAVGVRNDGPPVTDALVPVQTPLRGLV